MSAEVAKAAPKQSLALRLTRKWRWNYDTPRNGLRRRLYCLAAERHPWYDWGHRLMILTGDDFDGVWSEPKPQTWWYRLGKPKRARGTGYPTHPLSTYEIVTDYDTFRALSEGLNEDEMYRWQAFGVNQDGELHLGRQYWGGNFYGLSKDDVRLLRRYLRRWHRHEWFGLRSWLYGQGLHAAVYVRKPGACNAAPPKNQGGYSHWLCHEKRGHDGMHRYRSFQWGEIDGEPIGAFISPRPISVDSGGPT